MAVAIAGGGLVPGLSWLGAGAGLAVVGCTRPAGARVFWFVLAVAVIAGGLRASAIDRSATPVIPRAITSEPATLAEPLLKPAGEGAATAVATLGDRRVLLVATKFSVLPAGLKRGAVVDLSGKLVALGGHPGDARLARQGVAGSVLVRTVTDTGGRRGGVTGAIDRFSDAAQSLYAAAVGSRRAALVSGMALGSADAIGPLDREALRSSGLWHLVAASGGNIALVVALVMLLGWLVGAPDRWRLAACAVAVCLYVPLAGAGPSIQRAGIMGLAGLLSLALGREHRGADALALAAAGTLLLDPRAELDVGWQLSFAAAGALIAFAPPASRWFRQRGVPGPLAVALACSAVATVATAPVTLIVFGQLSVIGLVSNLLVVPLVGAVVWGGTLAALLTPIAPVVAAAVAQPAGLAAGLTLTVASWAEQRTYAVIGPSTALALLGVAFALWLIRPPRGLVIGLGAASLVALAVMVPRAPTEPRLVVLDVGQGSAALLQDGADGVLVDTGPIDGGIVRSLRRTGVRRLRAVITSHPAADHDGGTAQVLEAFPTDLLLDGGAPLGGPTRAAGLRAAAAHGVAVRPVKLGQRVQLGRIAFVVRWPTARAVSSAADSNDRAAVIQARIGALRAVIPADAEGKVLRKLPGLQTAVLVVSHHGSSDEDLPVVLAHLRPQLAVISLGAGNSYGHPTPSTLATLAAAGIPTLRTDRDGSIDIRAGPDGRPIVRQIR